MRILAAALLSVALLGAQSRPAAAWGDEGHETIATIADTLLKPDVRRLVHAMLAADPDPLVAHDIAAAATWADHYRAADIDGARARTRQWHFVDIELIDPSLDQGCFGHPPLPPAIPASLGPARACLVDKINQFAAELARPATPPDERLVALKFLLHFVGDVHQPLHASDDTDRGGNDKRVSAPGFRAGSLHHYWDSAFVEILGDNPRQIAATLLRRMSPAEIRRWSAGTPAGWARESFELADRDAYGQLPSPGRRFSYRLDDTCVEIAIGDVRRQLAKAGVRLAMMLNRTFAHGPASPRERSGVRPASAAPPQQRHARKSHRKQSGGSRLGDIGP